MLSLDGGWNGLKTCEVMMDVNVNVKKYSPGVASAIAIYNAA